MAAPGDLLILEFPSAAAWEAWLAAHHATERGLWIKYAKKGTGIASVSYAGALDVALCYGWIDGQTKSLDAVYYLQRFTPRGAKSLWSKINVAKVGALIEAGRMQPSGLAAVTLAQQDGRWQRAYDSPSTATVPDDLQRELDANPEAAVFFATLGSQSRYSLLYRLQTTKKAETRARLIERAIAKLREQQPPYP